MKRAHPWALPTRPTTRTDLLALGMTDHMLRTRVTSGALVTVRQGVFIRADAWPEDGAAQGILRARAEQAANPEGVMSHQSAALVLGLPAPGFARWHELPVAITLPTGHSSRTRSTVHHVGPLPSHHVMLDEEGYRITTPARTAVDLAARLDLPEALVLLDGAARMICASYVSTPRRRDYTTGAYITAARDLLSEAARTVRAGRLLDAVAVTLPCRESPAESLSAGHMILAGIPAPSFQAMLRTPRGTYFPDFLWEDARLIGECDGAVKYTGAAAVVAEKEREQDLRDNGWRFVRWLPKEVMLEPALVMARIARALSL
ncbi:MAG: DUF559 domain-containing protein [Propionibacteriaceae bacterium]